MLTIHRNGRSDEEIIKSLYPLIGRTADQCDAISIIFSRHEELLVEQDFEPAEVHSITHRPGTSVLVGETVLARVIKGTVPRWECENCSLMVTYGHMCM